MAGWSSSRLHVAQLPAPLADSSPSQRGASQTTERLGLHAAHAVGKGEETGPVTQLHTESASNTSSSADDRRRSDRSNLLSSKEQTRSLNSWAPLPITGESTPFFPAADS
ncbi:hypothetical protein AOLI_G00294060 [Acnodon oligacanthus]